MCPPNPFLIEDGKLHQVHFDGGCPGNLSAIGKLLEGRDAKEASALLRRKSLWYKMNILCRSTSASY